MIEDLYSGKTNIIHIPDAHEDTVKMFGVLQEQDVHKQKIVKIGDENFSHTNDLLWHQDRGYHKDIPHFSALLCLEADEGSSPTYFLNMQELYNKSPDSLKQKAEGVVCMNSVTKYYNQSSHPYEFKSKAEERLYRIKNRAEHPLVMEDDCGKFYFYSPAYTETELEDEFLKLIEEQEPIVHRWKKNDFVLINNFKILHRRDSTPSHVNRKHLRYSVNKHV